MGKIESGITPLGVTEPSMSSGRGMAKIVYQMMTVL